jgi:hypothetical protein
MPREVRMAANGKAITQGDDRRPGERSLYSLKQELGSVRRRDATGIGPCRVSDFEQATAGNASMLGALGAAAGSVRGSGSELEDLGG